MAGKHCVDLMKTSTHAQAAQCLVWAREGRLAAPAWEKGEEMPDSALQLWDKQRVALITFHTKANCSREKKRGLRQSITARGKLLSK